MFLLLAATITLLQAALVPPAQAAPAAPGLFADCVRVPPPSGLAKGLTLDRLECRARQVHAFALPPDGMSGDDLGKAYLAGMQQAVGEIRLGTPVRADGRTTLPFESGAGGVTTVRGWAAWIEPRDGRFRGAACFASVRTDAAAFCSAALDVALSTGFPPDVPVAPGPEVPRLVGWPMPAPAGCTASGNALTGSIQCPPTRGILNWSQLAAAPTEAELAALPGQLAPQFGVTPDDPSWAQRAVTCTIAGSPALGCWEFRQTVDAPERYRVAVAGVGRVDGIEFLLMCLYRSPDGRVPPTCAGQLEVTP